MNVMGIIILNLVYKFILWPINSRSERLQLKIIYFYSEVTIMSDIKVILVMKDLPEQNKIIV